MTLGRLLLQHNRFEVNLAGAVAHEVTEHLIEMQRLPDCCRGRDVLDMSG
jgi:hypothetical protein